MANNIRFNLQFNLDKEEEKVAAAILQNMGRKKSALVSKAIIKMFNEDSSVIEKEKRFDYTKEEDLKFRAQLGMKKIDKPKKAPAKVSNREIEASISSPTPVSMPQTKEVSHTEYIDNILEENNDLNDLLDGLDAFF